MTIEGTPSSDFVGVARYVDNLSQVGWLTGCFLAKHCQYTCLTSMLFRGDVVSSVPLITFCNIFIILGNET